MLYQDLADRLQGLIRQQVYPVGTSLPGVRRLSEQHSVSVSTAVNACQELERRGLLEAKPRSGFFVLQAPVRREPPRLSLVSKTPRPVTGQERVLHLAQAVRDTSIVNLGAAVPNPDLMPVAALERSFRTVLREQRRRCVGYEFPPGAPELRTQIARRLAAVQCHVTPDQILVTNSCHESLSIALRLITKPGDTVALESPTYYGLLQVIESLGLKALEIPTDPVTGISIEALSLALERWDIAACVLIPNFSNPLGVLLSDERKQALLKLMSKHGVPLVEDDIYGDLPFSGKRPRPIKSWDTEGIVYYCSSSSKTLSAGKDNKRAEALQYMNTVAVSTPSQLAMAHYLEHGHYERFLRNVCSEHARSVARMTDRVTQLFPAQTRVSRPAGGFVLWVELPGDVNTLELMEKSFAAGVSFAPGALFSASGKFGNCLRLNCAVRWDARVERALLALARLI